MSGAILLVGIVVLTLAYVGLDVLAQGELLSLGEQAILYGLGLFALYLLQNPWKE